MLNDSLLTANLHIISSFFSQGNHGEDCKELYYYLDSSPTHSYMKALYKYPQGKYPYGWLESENRERGITQPEFEIEDTGRFHTSAFFFMLMTVWLIIGARGVSRNRLMRGGANLVFWKIYRRTFYWLNPMSKVNLDS